MRLTAAALALGLLGSAPTLSSPVQVSVTDSGGELGTTYDVVLTVEAGQEARAREDLAAARARCRELEAVFSDYLADSEMSQLNDRAAGERVPVSEPMRMVLAGALHVAQLSGGAFDPTWRPLGALWDAAERDGAAPDGEALAGALARVGWQHVDLGADGVQFGQPGVQLGLAGVAKGFVIDAVFLALQERGYGDLIVNIGGDLRTAGQSAEGGPWTFRVVDPFDPGGVSAELEVRDTAVATSGNYLRRRTIGDHTVGHILDPRTGHPPAFDGSVTVLTQDAAMADALATALFVMGPAAGLELARATEGVDVVYATEAGLVTTLDDLRKK